MMRSKMCVVAAGLAAGLFVSTSSAQLVSQPANGVNGYFSDLTFPQAIADDFIIGAGGADLGVITWYGGYFPNNLVVPDRFHIRIHGESGGLPSGSLYLDLPSVAADSKMFTGTVIFGVDEYRYSFNLNGLHLNAGTYWLEIVNDTTQNADNWFWETGDLDATHGRLNEVFALEAPGVNWLANGADQAFSIEQGHCRADFNNDGVVDFFDVLAFLGAFSAGCP